MTDTTYIRLTGMYPESYKQSEMSGSQPTEEEEHEAYMKRILYGEDDEKPRMAMFMIEPESYIEFPVYIPVSDIRSLYTHTHSVGGTEISIVGEDTLLVKESCEYILEQLEAFVINKEDYDS